MTKAGVDELAEQLIRDGYVDNEADARLAALKIILALDDACAHPQTGGEPTDGV